MGWKKAKTIVSKRTCIKGHECKGKRTKEKVKPVRAYGMACNGKGKACNGKGIIQISKGIGKYLIKPGVATFEMNDTK